MKTSLKIFIFSCIACLFAEISSAQRTASASVAATIVTPIGIEKVPDGDLNFGNIAAGTSSGIIVLSTNGVRRAEGGATLPSTEGTISPAEFIVTGEGSYYFSITLPSDPITLINTENSAECMMVDSFTSSPENAGTLSGGKQTVKVGASLSINPAQSPGLYKSSTPFNVTVNYN